MRGVDTSIFQFDFDLTFCAFFLSPDLTIYGRYGSRKDATDTQFNIEAFKTAMSRALDIHKGFPANKAALAPKTGKAYEWKLPETMPSLEQMFRNPNFPKGCIHCHHVWRGVRRSMLMEKKPLPANLLYTYPMPDAIGMTVDPASGIKVSAVAAGTPAAKAGVLPGDTLEVINGQPIVSIADVQWILQNSPDAASLKIEVTRGAERKTLTATLAGEWRKAADFTWRTSCGDLRLGMLMIAMSDDERKTAGIKAGGLKVKNVYKNGAATNAGFQNGDLVIGVNGQPMQATEAEFLAYVRQKLTLGAKLKLTIVRGGKRQDIQVDVP